MDVSPVPMLATAGPLPRRPGWAYELKWDGMRLLTVAAASGLRFYSRNGERYDTTYPELFGLADALGTTAILDGEVIALDEDDRPSFALVTRRMRTRRAARARELAREVPVTYLVFDVLVLDGVDRRGLPYRERRDLLESLDLVGPAWTVPPYLDAAGVAWQAARDVGAEGVVAKRLSSRYRPGRSAEWIKAKENLTADVAVGGYVITGAGRLSLLVGEPGVDGLEYRGRVASGIGAEEQRRLLRLLERHVVARSPFARRPTAADVTWVHPVVVVEAAYRELTPAGSLRHPVFVRHRPDKTPAEL